MQQEVKGEVKAAAGTAAVREGGQGGENSSGLLQVHRMCPAIRQSALVDGALLGWALTWGVWDWARATAAAP